MSKAGFFEKIFVCMGFKNYVEFLIKYVLPMSAVVLISYILLLLFLTGLPPLFPHVLFVLGIITVIIYPYVVFEQKRVDINSNMHLFITFAGSIATLDVQRNTLFRKIAEKESFGEISAIAKKIVYFAKDWNLGFAAACRKVAVINPSGLLADFLDRFAIMMDLGQPLQIFLHDEQVAVMDDYAGEYKRAIERMKTTQDVYLALTMAMAFMMSVGLLLPLIAQSDMTSVMNWMILGVFITDLFVILFARSFIPADQLCHNLSYKDEGMKRIYNAAYIGLPVTVIILIILSLINIVPFIVSVSISIIPLFIIGIFAQNEEEEINKRDKSYPTFIRSLGSGIEVRQGGIVSSLYALQVHDLGPLNPMALNLYRRLRTGNNKARCWELFGAESGSNLIVQFTNIFSDSISLGGSAEKISEIISGNFQKLLSLRKLRLQLAASFRGAMYGAMVGFSISAYVAALITKLLSNILSTPLASTTEGDVTGTFGGIVPNVGVAFDFDKAIFMIGLMIIIHAVAAGIVIKIVEGGNMFAACFDIAIMIWMGVAASYFVPFVITQLLPGIGDLFNYS